MKLQKINVKCRCDIGVCKNDATYVLTGERVMSHRKLYLCTECARELYGLLGREFVPKSPVNLVRRAENRRQEEI